LIDYGAMSNGYMSDITRTWPANGTFTAEQREIYESLAAAHAAILAAIRPGVRPSELVAIGQRVMRERGDTAGAWLITNNYLGHPVGMSTHDPWGEGTDAPWQVGVVYNIEPVVDLPQRGWHFRIEDTIVVTANGVEVLTRGAPTGVSELVRLRDEPGIYERLVTPGAGGR
jgi:Xaa-Pro aminopeptidase